MMFCPTSDPEQGSLADCGLTSETTAPNKPFLPFVILSGLLVTAMQSQHAEDGGAGWRGHEPDGRVSTHQHWLWHLAGPVLRWARSHQDVPGKACSSRAPVSTHSFVKVFIQQQVPTVRAAPAICLLDLHSALAAFPKIHLLSHPPPLSEDRRSLKILSRRSPHARPRRRIRGKIVAWSGWRVGRAH